MTEQDENFENIEFELKMNQRQPNATRDNKKNETLKVRNLTKKGKELKMIKGFKTVVGNCGFDLFKKKFKTVIGDYSFLTWTPTWHRHTRLGIILEIGLLFEFFLNILLWVKA